MHDRVSNVVENFIVQFYSLLMYGGDGEEEEGRGDRCWLYRDFGSRFLSFVRAGALNLLKRRGAVGDYSAWNYPSAFRSSSCSSLVG